MDPRAKVRRLPHRVAQGRAAPSSSGAVAARTGRQSSRLSPRRARGWRRGARCWTARSRRCCPAASPASRLCKTAGRMRRWRISSSTCCTSTGATCAISRSRTASSACASCWKAATPAGLFRYSDHVVGGGVAFHRNACALGLEGIVSKRLGTRYRGRPQHGLAKDEVRAPARVRDRRVHRPRGRARGARRAADRLLRRRRTALGGQGRHRRGLERRRTCGTCGGASTRSRPSSRRSTRRSTIRGCAATRTGCARSWSPRSRSANGRTTGGSATRRCRGCAPTRIRATCAASSRPDGPPPRAPGARRPGQEASGAPRRMPTNDPVVRGIAVSHPDRVIYADLALTKLDVARYYGDVGARHGAARRGAAADAAPLRRRDRLQAEKGGCVMLRHGKAWGPRELRRVKIRELQKTGEYLVADTPEALVALAQMGDRRGPHLERRRRDAVPARPGGVRLRPGPAGRLARGGRRRAGRSTAAGRPEAARVGQDDRGQGLARRRPDRARRRRGLSDVRASGGGGAGRHRARAVHDDHRQQGRARAANPDRCAPQRAREHGRGCLLAARAAGRARLRAAATGTS